MQLSLVFQYIAASDLEMETLAEDPCRYHEAWHQLVSAKLGLNLFIMLRA